MPEPLRLLAGQLLDERTVTVFGLVLLRLVPCLTVAPMFAPRGLPVLARLGLALALAVLVFPLVSGSAAGLPPGPADLALLGLREALVGTLLGLLVAVPFYALEAAGRLVDTARGARMAEVLAAPTEVSASPLGAFLLLYGLALFMLLDGHVTVVASLAESYRALPLGAALPPGATADVGGLALRLGSAFFTIALGVAAPVLAVVLLVDLALGLAGRLAPELPLYFLGLPVKALGGIAVLLLALPLLAASFAGVFRLALGMVDLATRALASR